MAFDPGQTWDASVYPIHKPSISQGLKLRIRSLFLASAKSFGNGLSLDAPACLESQAPFVRKCAYGDVQRAIIRLSRHKHKHEDEHGHEKKYKISEPAFSSTHTHSTPRFPLSGTSRHSYAYLGGSRSSMSLEKALQESERVEEGREIYWSGRGNSEHGKLETRGNWCGLQLQEQNASRSSAISIDDENIGQKMLNSFFIKPDALPSSPLDTTFIEEYTSSISNRRDEQSQSPADKETTSRVGRKMHGRETTYVPVRRRSILQTPGVATRPPPKPTSLTKSAASPSSISLASSSGPGPGSDARCWTPKGSEPEKEALPPRGSLYIDRPKEATPKRAPRPPESGFVSPEFSLSSRRKGLLRTNSALSNKSATKTATRPAEQPRVTKLPSSAAVDHITCPATSARFSTASTSKIPAPCSRTIGSKRRLALTPRHRIGQNQSFAEPNSKDLQLPCRLLSEAAGALSDQAQDVPSDRGRKSHRNHKNDDTKGSRAEIRQIGPDHGPPKDDDVESGAHSSAAISSRSSPPLHVQGWTTNANESQLEASPVTSAAETSYARSTCAGRSPKQPIPIALFPFSSLRKHHPRGRHVTIPTTTIPPTPTTTTAETPRPRQVSYPAKSPTGPPPKIHTTPRQHDDPAKARPKTSRGEPRNGACLPAKSPAPPNLSKELPLEPPRKNTLRSTFFKRPRRTMQKYLSHQGASKTPLDAQTQAQAQTHAHGSALHPPPPPFLAPSTEAEKSNTRGSPSPHLHYYYYGLSSRHSHSDASTHHKSTETLRQQHQQEQQKQQQQQEQEKRKHSTLLHRPAFSDIEEAIAFDGTRGSEPRYRILHSYNSPAYKNLPIWG
ncbi:hypothetical protein E4U21_006445 [Claviceps maximensis]|nr:hypothetical protein E4U21_006445 [Claviceps maximensis]